VPAPGIRTIAVTALKGFEKIGEIREQLSYLEFVERPDEAEVSRRADQIFCEILVKERFEPKALRILVVDFLSAVHHVALIGTPFVRHDHIRVSVKQQTRCAKKSEGRREGCVPI